MHTRSLAHQRTSHSIHTIYMYIYMKSSSTGIARQPVSSGGKSKVNVSYRLDQELSNEMSAQLLEEAEACRNLAIADTL